ncbi:STAS domain-containing protein [Bacillus sp. FJAT-50079]|uniref:STAS domain-containing protein n=1 Tax=Bacillus sp. FJAT-50079 TaxID=2833577 RepID=UPI001BC95E22|nr:STAS domain-containing protein [Bacillus sp. FJAT-50079]MBS4209246.1 STAS domain-containing protein [Bacillus sp. FJAT-50079]
MEKVDQLVKSVNGVEFDWDVNRGIMKYEGEEALLFWIGSSFKTFFDTIEEIVGDKNARIVMETTGYRTGQIVSDFFTKKIISTEQVLQQLPKIFKSSGWGCFTIVSYSEIERVATITLKDDWELKINKHQEKKQPGCFLAAHWAGIFSKLFGENMCYEITKHPFWGDDDTELKLFPTKVSPVGDIKDILRRKEEEEITTLEAMVEDRTRDLQKLVKDLSTPIIPVLENIVVVPMMGRYDKGRSAELIDKTLQDAMIYQANIVIFDVTGMKKLDDHAISSLEKVTKTVSLIGATPIIVGISPNVSMQLISSGVYLTDLKCFATLKHAVHYALALEGMQITPK